MIVPYYIGTPGKYIGPCLYCGCVLLAFYGKQAGVVVKNADPRYAR